MRRPRLFPPQIEVRDEAGHEDKIERAVADNLIGDAQLTAFGVTRFGWGHGLLPDRSREGYRVVRSGAIGFIFSPSALAITSRPCCVCWRRFRPRSRAL